MTPDWLAATAPDDTFPTVEVSGLGVSARVPAPWRYRAIAEAGDQAGAQWSHLPGEGLRIVRLEPADPEARLATWLELPMAMLGGLDPQTLTAPVPGALLEWGRLPASGLAVRWQLDACEAYGGMASLRTEAGDDLVRQYVVLARRGTVAWKIALTLPSAVLPGRAHSDPELVATNDHVRAAACLGSLAFDVFGTG